MKLPCSFGLIIASIMLLIGQEAAAEGLIYNKMKITIIPHEEKTIMLTPEEEKRPTPKPDSTTTTTPETAIKKRERKEYIVDVRPLDFFDQPGFFYQQPFTDSQGMMFVYEPADIPSIGRTNFLASVDIVFITPEGFVAQIAPSLVLRDLDTTLRTEKPMRAVLFLKGGTATAGIVQPGDMIEGPVFRKAPLILNAPK